MPDKPWSNQTQFREFAVSREAVDPKQRTIELSFASEEPILRFYGWEVLSHSDGDVIFDRINKSGPLLLDHERSNLIGVVEKAWIGEDRKSRALVRFGRSPLAEEVFQDVFDGIRRNVSVSYTFHTEPEEAGEREGQPVYRFRKWEPMEVSLVSVPADTTVGVGRSKENKTIPVTEEKPMPDEVKNAPAPAVDTEAQLRAARDEVRKQEKNRIAEILAIGDKFKLIDMAREAVASGMPLDEFRTAVLAKVDNTKTPGITVGQDRSVLAPWKSNGEFLYSVRFNPTDPRLLSLRVDGERAQSMGVGSAGGFMVPEQFSQTLLSVSPQEAIFRPRATVIPAGNPPDAAITMPALDQSTAHDIYAGMSGSWIGEGVAKPETQAFFREIKLEPKEGACTVVATDKLLRNWAAAEATLSNMMRLAMIGMEDTAYLSGNGVARPLGINNVANGARILVNRTAANAIAYADVVSMYARIMGTNPIWIASPTTKPQLMQMADASSAVIWQPNAREGEPQTLFGIPLVYNQRSPSLGTAGDLILADLSYYLIKLGSGPYVSTSEHVYFTSNKTVFKVFFLTDGSPWLNTPIALEGDAAQTISPFVVLN